jgi:hypothetical protein
MLVDGLTAANDIGLTTAVPARVVVHTDARRRSIPLGKLTIQFKLTAPSKLYWAGRPAMRVVQALHWLKDILPTDADDIVARIAAVAADPVHGPAIRKDLRSGLPTLPAWMQRIVRDVLQRAGDTDRGAMPRVAAASNVVAHAGQAQERGWPSHTADHVARRTSLKAHGASRRSHKARSGRSRREPGE